MLTNYLLVAWRNLVRNKVFSFINIAGLAIGLSVCFLIYQYVQFERSYDRFHEKAGRIYRVPIGYSGSFSSVSKTATNHPAVGPALKADFPEVEDFARLVRTTLFGNAWTLSHQRDTGDPVLFNESRMYLADASFLTMFSFPLAEGNAEEALKEPLSVVMTESVARKYFGDESALGRELLLNSQTAIKVTGVLKDLPQNSHLQFDILISFASLGDKWGYDVWGWPEFYNYVLLAPGADPAALEARLPAFVDKYLADIMKQFNFACRFSLQPITDIHLTSHLSLEQDVNGSERTVYFLTLLALFILVIAWINYINLSTAKSLERSKEVGLRKVVGANRPQLVFQFLLDAFLVNLLAMVVASLLIALSMPLFEHIVGRDISGYLYTSGLWHNFSFWIIVPAVFAAGVLLAGLYPSFMLSSFRPALVLKGKFYRSSSGALVRKCMVSFQYVLSVFLIAGTVTIQRQQAYMEDTDLGYAQDQILVLRSPAAYDSLAGYRMESFKNELLRMPAIRRAAASSEVPGETIEGRNDLRRATQEQGDGFVTYIQMVDPDFIETFGMALTAGRSFREGDEMSPPNEEGADRQPGAVRIMINEAAATSLGYVKPEDALHEKVVFRFGQGDHQAEVIGVVKNYHQLSLREQFEPILYVFPGWVNWKYISVRVETKDLAQTLEAVEKTYLSSFEHSAFEYFFLDDYFNRQYSADRQFGTIFTTFTLLAIIVACLGLLGLSVFTITQRIKEIGIRKVMGASFSAILLLFSKDSVRLLVISYLLAVPLVYMAAGRWLESFAFHITPGWQVFMLPPVLMLLISVGTIFAVCLRAAFINPAISLRHE